MTISKDGGFFSVNMLASRFGFPPVVMTPIEAEDQPFILTVDVMVMTVQGEYMTGKVASHLVLKDWATLNGYMLVSSGKSRLAFSHERTALDWSL